MEWLLTTLSDAMSGGLLVSLVASFGWGVTSILLSPCHLSSIPLIIGFLIDRHENRPRLGLVLSLVFATGILTTIALIGIITAALGRLMGDVGRFGTYAVAAVFFIVGLYLMDIIRLPGSGITLHAPGLRSGILSAGVLGLVFGVALGPCTFAFMAPVLIVFLQVAGTSPVAAGALLLAFGLGHAGIIAAAGGLTSRVQAYLDWTNRSTTILWAKRAAGFLVLLGGIYAVLEL